MSPQKIELYSLPVEEVDRYSDVLMSLVMSGYGFTGGEEMARFQVDTEYGGDNQVVYFLTVEGREVGSLVMSNMSPASGREDAQKLWANMPKDTAQKVLKLSDKVFGVGGIVVHPEFKNKKLDSGISVVRTLYQKFAEEQKPVWVVGSTKNPLAVMSRANVLADYGLRTFYGYHEVTPQGKGLTPANVEQYKELLHGYWTAKGRETNQQGVYFSPTDTLLPTVPDTAGLPDYVRKAYEPVAQAQREVGEEKTAVTALFSVSSAFFD